LLNKAAGKPILGVVGEEFFQRHVIEVNFEMGTVTIYDRRTFAPPLDATLVPLNSAKSAKVQMPGTLEGAPGVKITLDIGSSNTAMIDTGPVTNRWDAEGRPWTPDGSGVVEHGEFKKSENRLMTAKSIGFAGYTLSDVPVTTMPKDFVAPADVSLGVNLLDRFDVIFDVGGKRLWLKPRANYDAPFRHRLVGLGWKPPADADGLEVIDVARNSPAEAAGLKKGDVIVGFNSKPATPEAFAALKAGDAVELKLRDGSVRTFVAARFY
ncbi:MAG TPA: PDZ domain-containing protein, partial [Hyphomonadaceae bacterium]|nr:PDZ domain-containing protein [Hyphomonadaceae bacterium]